jgi:hypothetical protein
MVRSIRLLGAPRLALGIRMKTIIITRPATLGELAASLDLSLVDMNHLVRRHRIAPALRVGRVGFYGPREIRRICGLAGGGRRPALVAPG